MLFTTLISASLFMATALGQLVVDTPQLTQCQDATITWKPAAESKGPYNLIVVDPKNACDSNLKDLGDHDGSSAPWKVDLPAGTQVQLSLQDGTGDEAWSGPVTITPSNDISCLSAADQAKQAPPAQPSTGPTTSPQSTTGAITTGSDPSTGSTTGSTTGSSSNGPAIQAAGAAVNGIGQNTKINGAVGSSFSSPILVLSAVAAAFAVLL
jgi:hypothetical protein